ncbi:retrovirus-related Pol polyprotein from transposon 297 [Trichonephila clavipes]|nr:retrovirus-related Pol polyprotein from transposon 297 [Trichonephila clavipes]
MELEEKQKAVVVSQQREREFELEKMKIQHEMQKLSQAPVTSQQLENPKLELNRIIPRFNSKEDEMGLYLTIFERQVKFLNIPEKTWTAYQIGSLPPDIAHLIAREDEDDAQNYEKVKEMFLKRFRVTGHRFRQYFSQQKKNPDSTWKPFPIKKSQPVGGSHDNHSPGPSRTVPRSPSFKNEGRNPIQCYGCGTPGVIQSKCPKCMRANEMETAVNCMTLFNLNSNLYPTSVIVLKIFGEKIAVCADTGGSHTIAEFLVLPDAKGNKTLLGLDFLNAAGIVFDVQGGKWHFSGNPRGETVQILQEDIRRYNTQRNRSSKG